MKKFTIISVVITVIVTLYGARLVIQNTSMPTHLGHQAGKLAAMPDKPNAVSSQTLVAEKHVAPLAFKASHEQTMQAVLNALTTLGNNQVKVQESQYIYTVFTSKSLHFHDDVEILLDDATQQVHFRSQSRAGYSDLDVNRKRYQEFKRIYNQ